MTEEVGVGLQSYDPAIAAFVVDTKYETLVQSLDPVSFALKLVYRRLMSPQQAQEILDDSAKTRSEKNLAFLNLVKSSPNSTWFSSLLEVFGEERTTMQLKEILEKGELVKSLIVVVVTEVACSVLTNGAECSNRQLCSCL